MNKIIVEIIVIFLFIGVSIVQGINIDFNYSNKSFKMINEKDIDICPIFTRWIKTYGGKNSEWGYSIQQTIDNNYVFAGNTNSFGSGEMDVWVCKINNNGNILWNKTYGGPDDDGSFHISQCSDEIVFVRLL